MQQARQRRGGGYHRQGEMDPEDIFNMFFGMPAGGGAHMHRRGNVYHYNTGGGGRQQQQGGGGGGGNAGYAQLVQLMPLLLLFLFSFLGNNQRADHPFRSASAPPPLPPILILI